MRKPRRRPRSSSHIRARIWLSWISFEAALKARGFEPLIDRTEIYAFEDWWKRIEGLIGNADTVIFTLSPKVSRARRFALRKSRMRLR